MKQRIYAIFVIALLTIVFNVPDSYSQPTPPSPGHGSYLPILVNTDNPKHGLAWSWGADSRNAGVELGTSWYYHWAAKGWSHVPAEIEFVPMLWGDTKLLREKFVAAVPHNHCGFILFANEPEFDSQSNMTVSQLIEMTDWLATNYPCARLVGPQSHVCYYEVEKHALCPDWGGTFKVESYIQQYKQGHGGHNPPIWAYGLHYGDTSFWPDHIAAMLRRYGITPRFWYTEFNYCGNSSLGFRLALNKLNINPLVDRYAYWSNLGTDGCMLYDFETKEIDWRGRVYATFGR